VQTTPGIPKSGLADAGQLAGLEPFDERCFVVDAAAGRVDEPGAGLHPGDLGVADQPAGFIVQRRVDREVVDPRDHVGDGRHGFDAEFLRPLGSHEGIVTEDVHFEALGPLGNGEPDSPEADDAERLAGDLGAHVVLAVPLALEQALIGRRDVARQG
jgi:hypothetical protein